MLLTWKGVLKVCRGTSPAEALQAIKNLETPGQDFCEAERDAQVRVAKMAAAQLLLSGCFGSLDKQSFEVTIGGHANDRNDGKPWQGRDRVLVSVEQVPTSEG